MTSVGARRIVTIDIIKKKTNPYKLIWKCRAIKFILLSCGGFLSRAFCFLSNNFFVIYGIVLYPTSSRETWSIYLNLLIYPVYGEVAIPLLCT